MIMEEKMTQKNQTSKTIQPKMIKDAKSAPANPKYDTPEAGPETPAMPKLPPELEKKLKAINKKIPSNM